MHEFELGVLKQVFIHLIYGLDSVAELDLHHNIIDRKVQDLLFAMESWHASAKMHLHMDWSLEGKMEHKRIKAFYAQTNKNQFKGQIALQEQQQARLHAMKDVIEEEALLPTNPEENHYIAKQDRHLLIFCNGLKIMEMTLLSKYNFTFKLVDHFLLCLLPQGIEISEEYHGKLIIKDQMIYEHKTLCINYTTYNNWHDQDTINPHQQSDVMVLADKDDHSFHFYWYYQVVKIFHAMVQILGSGEGCQQLEFLWGHCYGFDHKAKSGPAAKCIYQIGFMEGNNAFEFIDPANVLCTVHLISQFRYVCVFYWWWNWTSNDTRSNVHLAKKYEKDKSDSGSEDPEVELANDNLSNMAALTQEDFFQEEDYPESEDEYEQDGLGADDSENDEG
ncbi:hypothetical protein C0995_004837 [Termitomyces sp. Mi166|nr:hypothetical protein C0995_004837 [Termitomyces sp. Mi166\